MNAVTPAQAPGLSLAGERRIDAVCVRFEDAWKSGRRPLTEDYLGDVTEPERSELLRELLLIEVEYRRRLDDRPAAEVPPTSTEGSPHVPGYELHQEIGRGGMGVVYEARHLALNRVVALKMILTGRLATEEEVRRFTTEARLASELDHPNIVPVYDVGEAQGQHYFTMKLVRGESLAEQVARGPLPSRRAAELVAAVARAVHHAHKRLVHRDLKPANILLDEDGTPHVTDFGLAKRVEGGEMTLSGLVVGTPEYMAPEQASGLTRGLTARTDVYALGAVLYALLTGRPPFRAETVFDTLKQVIADPPAPPRLLNPKVDRDLQIICLKCLEKDPSARYESAEALAEDLDNSLNRRPIKAHPPRWWEKLGSHFGHPANDFDLIAWRNTTFGTSISVTVCHLVMFWLVMTGQPNYWVWLCLGANILLIWTVFAHFFVPRHLRLNQSLKLRTTLWLGHTFAFVVLYLAAGAPGTPERPGDAWLWSVYPGWATLYGLTFFVLGGFVWGRFHLVSLAWFLVALVMAVSEGWTRPLLYLALYSVNMAMVVAGMRRPASSEG